jgi:hypothetical protein
MREAVSDRIFTIDRNQTRDWAEPWPVSNTESLALPDWKTARRLPREQIKGALWCRGDTGRSLARRCVAIARKLIPASPPVARLTCQPFVVPPPRRLHLDRRAP